MAAAASDSSEGSALRESHEAASPGELFDINLVPSDLCLKFRKQTEGFCIGLNFKRWKFVYEPLHGDIQLLSKKIPLIKYLNIQIGICHSFHSNATGWKWNLSTCLAGDCVSHIRNKATLGLCDLRIGWRADYVPSEIEGEISTAESLLNMKHGCLHVSK